jgi:hypothetical protein
MEECHGSHQVRRIVCQHHFKKSYEKSAQKKLTLKIKRHLKSFAIARLCDEKLVLLGCGAQLLMQIARQKVNWIVLRVTGAAA